MSGWPSVTVLICGTGDSPAAARTRNSVGASDYPGELEALTGQAGDGSSPPAIANGLARQASGTYLLILAAGTTLDRRCIARLVKRAEAGSDPIIVTPQQRGPDGRPVLGHGVFSTCRAVADLLPLDRLPVEVTGLGTMLVRTTDFIAAGGYGLGLTDSPALGADLASRVVGSTGRIDRVAEAVGFVPVVQAGLRRLPAYRLTPSDAIGSDRQELEAVRPRRTLWIAPHLPDPGRSGVDARHLSMMKALRSQGADLTVFSTHGTCDARSSRRFEALGISRLAPPPDERWALGAGYDHWLEEVLGAQRWNTIIVGHPHSASGIIPAIKRRAGDARTVVDFASVRFPAAHDPAAEPDVHNPHIEAELAPLAGADAVVTATDADRRLIEFVKPAWPSFVWNALGEDLEPGSGGALDGSALYVGDLFHNPNAQGLEWWLDLVAAEVEARMGRPVPLRAVGTGSEVYRAIWKHPRKLHLAGWQPDLGVELARARLLVIPLTYATGTGGRMATALASGLPVAASAPAAALLPAPLAELVQVGSSPAELAGIISDLLTDDVSWETERARILETDIAALRRTQTARFFDWLGSIEAREDAEPPPSRRSGSRRGLRRPSRAS